MNPKHYAVAYLALSFSHALAGPFGPSNYSECVLAKMTDVKSDPAALAVARQCRQEFGAEEAVPQGSGLGLLSYKNGDECSAKKSTSTPSRIAAIHIIRACNRLYDKPTFVDFDASLRAK